MKKMYRVEFNNTGFYSGAGIWETIDEIAEIEAENAQEAIEFAKDWWIESASHIGNDTEEARKEIEEFAWRAAAIERDDNGYLESYNWEFED